MRARRKFTREFKVDAVRLVRERGVTVAQAARDLDLGQTVLRTWLRAYASDPKDAFPDQGQQKPEQVELTQLRRQAARLKVERDILKKPRPTSPRSRREVRLRGDAPRNLADRVRVRGARDLAQLVLRVAPAPAQPAGAYRCGDPGDDPTTLRRPVREFVAL